MSKSDPPSPHNHTNWQLLTEFLVPELQEAEAEIIDHVADVLRQFNLDPGQLEQILSAISQSLEGLEGDVAPLRLRISVSGIDLASGWQETHLQAGPDLDQDSQRSGGGLGFFLVKRIVSQLKGLEPKEYRLVEVLLYRE